MPNTANKSGIRANNNVVESSFLIPL